MRLAVNNKDSTTTIGASVRRFKDGETDEGGPLELIKIECLLDETEFKEAVKALWEISPDIEIFSYQVFSWYPEDMG